MSDITQVLNAIEAGDPHAAEQLLPLVYDELRRLAARQLAREKPGQTLDATALVHEAYLRLVANGGRESADSARHQAAHASRSPEFANRRHFLAAAAQSMRRILVENARRKRRIKHGGAFERADVDLDSIPTSMPDDELLALDEALEKLAVEEPDKARLIHLRFFLGMTNEEAGEVLGIAAVTAKRHWRYARAWLHRELRGSDGKETAHCP